MKPHLYVIVPVHDRCAVTMRFARCLAAQTEHNWTLVLVDDGSSDGTAAAVAAVIPDRLTVVRGDGTWWWAKSLAMGLEEAGRLGAGPADAVLLCNDDVEFTPEFLATGLAAITTGGFVLATCLSRQTGAVVDAGQRLQPRTLSVRPCRKGEPPNVLSTRGLFARWPEIQSVGGFVPERLPHYLSDFEFTYRAGCRGVTLSVAPDLRLTVDESTTGVHTFGRLRGRQLRAVLFSNRCARNPRHWLAFASMVSPQPWRLLNQARILARTAVIVATRP